MEVLTKASENGFCVFSTPGFHGLETYMFFLQSKGFSLGRSQRITDLANHVLGFPSVGASTPKQSRVHGWMDRWIGG